MFQKFKDGANKLKAKIGGDDLDEKLVQVVSEENWQASTQQLHEIANAAYNYEKWQRINEFIWEKLKKSKSWRKILKTFNLIEFLLKNGPPSIISNFKYDLYQLRTFESYSNYVEGIDKGETIRERAKIVVTLLGNEEMLEEERVKAKAIREKMANVVGGTTYGSGGSGSYGGSNGSGGYGGNSGYGYGGSNKYENENKKKNENNAYNYGTGPGAFGDYSYNKSTLDKYKDASKTDKSTTNESRKEEKKPEIVVETKKPFEKVASKLSKPGERKVEVFEQVKPTVTAPTTTATQPVSKPNNNEIFDIFGSDPAPAPTPAPTSTPFTFAPEPPKQVQQPVQPPVQTQPQPQNTLYTQPPNTLYTQPQAPQPQAPQIPTQLNYPQGQYGQPPFGQPQYGQPQPFGQPYGQPQPPAYGQPNYGQSYPPQPFGQTQYGGFPPQQPSFGYQQQPQTFGQPNPYANPQFNAQGYSPYNQPQPQAKPAANLGITLSTAPKNEEFGGFSSSTPSTAQNVGWLSNTEKGLIDFSDFGAQIKKETKPAAKSSEINNNIQIDAWSW